MRRFYGSIRNIYTNNRIIEIKIRQRLVYFYLSRSLMKRFQMYLRPGLYIDFFYDPKQINKNFVSHYEIVEIIKMTEVTKRQRLAYYDKELVKKGVYNVLSRPGNKMFLDLEFTMPPYEYQGTFNSEIIQFGYIVENEDGQIVDSDAELIRPQNKIGLNKRTYSFLNLTKQDFKEALTYKQFYYRFKKVINKYQPIIYVWGKNDISILDRSYVQHNLPKAAVRLNYINLMQLIKNYFSLKTDVGLFNAPKLFDEGFDNKQTHDALEDAQMTSMVYHLFKNYAEKHLSENEE